MGGAIGECASGKDIPTEIRDIPITEYIRVPYAAKDNGASIVGLQEGYVVPRNGVITEQAYVPIAILIRFSGACVRFDYELRHMFRLGYWLRAEEVIYPYKRVLADPKMRLSSLLYGGRFTVVNVMDVDRGLLPNMESESFSADVVDLDVRPLVHPEIALADYGLFNGSLHGAPRFVHASYGENKYQGSYGRVNPGTDSSGPRPPAHLAVVLGSLCFLGFVLVCIGVEGTGYPLYFAGG